ncbi:NADP-dependent oxidoreductase domain-containing protein [Pyronema omphalodes]|nr:NADP-dependent oxidoreductase domain-containing protein [Pyronema omphalodes]
MPSIQCILNTGNIMTAASEVLRSPPKSSTELITSLRSHIRSSPPSPPPSPSLSSTTKSPLYIPLPPTPEPLAEERSEYDVTVKLFHLSSAPTTSHEAHTRDAVKRVLENLGIETIDLLILSLPGINFDADDFANEDSTEDVEAWLATYRTLEELHQDGMISRLGISEFGTTRLEKLLPRTTIKPSVNQINVRDCCVVPKPLILFAKQEGIELLTHNDCTDILPQETLQNVLVDEFALLGEERKVLPQWVAKYTAVIRSRGVVENKGYIAMAEIH